MKPSIKLNIGRETTDEEIEEIVSSFSSHFEVDYEKNISRLAAIDLPLIIDFAIGAVAGGVFYDALKSSLLAIREKFKKKKIGRNPAITIRVKNDTYVISEEKIFLQSFDVKLSFNSVEEFVEYLEQGENENF